jgi:hypothetical protein
MPAVRRAFPVEWVLAILRFLRFDLVSPLFGLFTGRPGFLLALLLLALLLLTLLFLTLRLRRIVVRLIHDLSSAHAYGGRDGPRFPKTPCSRTGLLGLTY